MRYQGYEKWTRDTRCLSEHVNNRFTHPIFEPTKFPTAEFSVEIIHPMINNNWYCFNDLRYCFKNYQPTKNSGITGGHAQRFRRTNTINDLLRNSACLLVERPIYRCVHPTPIRYAANKVAFDTRVKAIVFFVHFEIAPLFQPLPLVV